MARIARYSDGTFAVIDLEGAAFIHEGGTACHEGGYAEHTQLFRTKADQFVFLTRGFDADGGGEYTTPPQLATRDEALAWLAEINAELTPAQCHLLGLVASTPAPDSSNSRDNTKAPTMPADNPGTALANLIHATDHLIQFATKTADKHFAQPAEQVLSEWNAAAEDYARRREWFQQWQSLRFEIGTPHLEPDRLKQLEEQRDKLQKEAGGIPTEPTWSPVLVVRWQQGYLEAARILAAEIHEQVILAHSLASVFPDRAVEIRKLLDGLENSALQLANFSPFDFVPQRLTEWDTHRRGGRARFTRLATNFKRCGDEMKKLQAEYSGRAHSQTLDGKSNAEELGIRDFSDAPAAVAARVEETKVETNPTGVSSSVWMPGGNAESPGPTREADKAEWDEIACGLLIKHKGEVKKLADLYPFLKQRGYPHLKTAMYNLPNLRDAAKALGLMPDVDKEDGRSRRGTKFNGQVETAADQDGVEPT